MEIVRRAWEAFQRREPWAAPDLDFDLTAWPDWPGQREFHGSNAFNEFISAWTEPYDEWEAEVEKILDAGGKRVVATVHQRGKPRGSDSWVDFRFAIVYTIEGGLIQRAMVYDSIPAALEAAGLSE